MASRRASIRQAVVERIAALRDEQGRPFLGSVNAFARSPAQVNDAPSVDVILGTERPVHRPASMVDRTLEVVVRIWHRPRADLLLDDLVERVRHALESDLTLGGLVIEIRAGDTDTDEGWAPFAGLGSIADCRFTVRWEDEET